MTEREQYFLLPDISSHYPKGHKRHFTIRHGARSYTLEADPWITSDLVWASQKCWFMPGSVVIITDDIGISQIFVKEQ